MERIKSRVDQRTLNRDCRGPDSRREQRCRDIRALAGALAPVERRDNRGIQADCGRVISAARHRECRRSTGISRQRQQSGPGPVRRDVEARKIGVRAFVAVARDVCIDDARVHLLHVFIRELQFSSRGMWRVDDDHVRPLHESFDDRASLR